MSQSYADATIGRKYEETEVVIIGNGPSGISLSYMLSGNWPYYNGGELSDEYLQLRLQDGEDLSLVEQELSYLSEGLQGRSNNPVALLFDSLTHPDADLGLEKPSVLDWRLVHDRAIPHVVLGKFAEGGAWQMITGSMQTLSLGNWMSLPNRSFKSWLQTNLRQAEDCSSGNTDRATVEQVRGYYKSYVQDMKLTEHMRPRTTVKSVERVYLCRHEVDDESGEQNLCCANRCGHFTWEVRGQQEVAPDVFTEFLIRAPNVVLAVGSYDVPNKLGVPGESDQDYVHYGLSEIEAALEFESQLDEPDPVLVVGAGLSAADTVLAALERGLPVLHCFRRRADDPHIVYSKLPATIYPEYHRVEAMKKGPTGVCNLDGYTPFAEHRVLSFNSDGRVLLIGPNDQEIMVTCSLAAIHIGARPNLSFFAQEGRNLAVTSHLPLDPVRNPVQVDPFTHQVLKEPGLFAMGPLVGDNFVRFLRGGALAITSHLHRKRTGKL